MSDMTDRYPSAGDYNARISAYYNRELPEITAKEVLDEMARRCSAGQQYATFPNTISDANVALLQAEDLIVTRNYVHGANRDGAADLYIGFQVALNAIAASGNRTMIISEVETNGISGGGGGPDNFLTSDIEVGTIDSEGVLNPNPNRLRTVDFTELQPGTYTLLCTSSTISWQAFAFRYSVSDEFIERLPSNWAYIPLTITVSETSKFKFIFTDASGSVALQPSDMHNLMLLATDS